MTDTPLSDRGAADPTTEAFWDACTRHELLLQRCTVCGHHQLYPRPFCLSCEGMSLQWVQAKGTGTVYSLTTMRLPVSPELPPPYVLALIDLDEGVRVLSNIEGPAASIGDRVTVAWRARIDLPPLPVFVLAP